MVGLKTKKIIHNDTVYDCYRVERIDETDFRIFLRWHSIHKREFMAEITFNVYTRLMHIGFACRTFSIIKLVFVPEQ